MGNILNRAVSVSDIAKKFELDYFGKDLEIKAVVPMDQNIRGALSFSTKKIEQDLSNSQGVIIAPLGSHAGQATVIYAENPRLTFAKIVEWLNLTIGFQGFTEEPKIHSDASISPLAFIGPGVEVGQGSIIGAFAVIMDGTVIGKNCVIKPHAVIGEEGFGFERDVDGLPIRLIHLGKVVIGDEVEIGSFTTVCKGTLGNTIIENSVKVDSHVHIAHNCLVKKGAMIIACAEVSGGVVIGEFAWIGPNASIIQKVKIGDRAFVGIAANVIQSVSKEVTVIGNPAKPLVKRAH